MTQHCLKIDTIRPKPNLDRGQLWPCLCLALATLLLLPSSLKNAVHAQTDIDAYTNPRILESTTRKQVSTDLTTLLQRYCANTCELIKVLVRTRPTAEAARNLGFEGLGDDPSTQISYELESITAVVQIDAMVSEQNRSRLGDILSNRLSRYQITSRIEWRPVVLPEIGRSAQADKQLKDRLERKLRTATLSVFDQYCPELCLLTRLSVSGQALSRDQASQFDANTIFVPQNGGPETLRVESIDVEYTVASQLDESTRAQIEDLLAARLAFIEPVKLISKTTDFPESERQRRRREQAASDDPYNLGRLKETLNLFRELAGTKEIIKETTDSRSSISREESSSSIKDQTTNTSLENSQQATDTLLNRYSLEELVLYGAGLLVLLGLLLMMVLRWGRVQQDARAMTQLARGAPADAHAGAGESFSTAGPSSSGYLSGGHAQGAPHSKQEQSEAMAAKLRRDDLQSDLIDVFLKSPKVGRETFTKVLQEEGIEATAKYLHLFGQVVVMQLLDNPNLSRDLFALSEYYNKSEFSFSLEEELQLLSHLKTKVTASEIRLLTRRTHQQFDFLNKLSSNQIFYLIRDESTQLQSIVLTQLDTKRRRQVFDFYQGNEKLGLMRELSRSEAIPKEFLANVALALQSKVRKSPEFDTEQLRSSEILLDLMEKSSLRDQKTLMRDLEDINPEAARAIKLRLVTVEVIPFLKSGQLLEIVLGMDQKDLLTFLRGTGEHIRNLLLANAPEELAASWVEQLEAMGGIDDKTYQLVQIKIQGRIKSLANSGAINLLELNELLFARSLPQDGQRGPGDLSDNPPEGESGEQGPELHAKQFIA